MATDRQFSRRKFLGVLAGTAAASAVAVARARTASAAVPTTSAAAASPTTPAAPKRAGEVVVWQTVDYLPQVTQLINDKFTQVSKDKGFNLTFEELPNNAQGNDRFLAAIQAGTPPDIWRVYDYQTQYWRIQNQSVDITDLLQPYTTMQGGYWQPVEQTAQYQGKWYAVPMAVNCWPMHVRQDLLEKAGVSYPKTWDEFRDQGKQLTKAPLYYYGHTLGKINDTNNHFIGMLWTFGGKLQNEDGTLAVKEGDESWLGALDLIQKMYADDKIIPPGSINWDDGGNNQGYQSEQLVVTSNPTSVYNWCLQNKPELAKATKFYSYPAGPGGTFGQVDVWGQSLFKNGKGGDDARTLLTAFADPTWYGEFINDKLQGRFVPVYKNMIDAPIWKQDLYAEYRGIIETGRIMGHASAPLGAISELTTKYIIADLVQDVLVKRQKPADALSQFVRTAQEIYNKPENRA